VAVDHRRDLELIFRTVELRCELLDRLFAHHELPLLQGRRDTLCECLSLLVRHDRDAFDDQVSADRQAVRAGSLFSSFFRVFARLCLQSEEKRVQNVIHMPRDSVKAGQLTCLYKVAAK
jgi:hypothetical protein